MTSSTYDPSISAGDVAGIILRAALAADTPVRRAAVTAAVGAAGAAVQLALFWRSPGRASRQRA
jgi:hypothetical protein